MQRSDSCRHEWEAVLHSVGSDALIPAVYVTIKPFLNAFRSGTWIIVEQGTTR